MNEVTVRTLIEDGRTTFQRNVTLWLNGDGSVALLGNLPHGTTIIVDQALVNDLQKMVNAIHQLEGA